MKEHHQQAEKVLFLLKMVAVSAFCRLSVSLGLAVLLKPTLESNHMASLINPIEDYQN